MRKWTYVEPAEDGVTPVWITLTDDEIIDFYYEYWAGMMRKAGKVDMINRENCIQDFAVIHWAVEGEKPKDV